MHLKTTLQEASVGRIVADAGGKCLRGVPSSLLLDYLTAANLISERAALACELRRFVPNTALFTVHGPLCPNKQTIECEYAKV